MITLNRIYSETNLFTPVIFHSGINIILGKYSDGERSVNGIGKSTLVRLIDFALLSSSKNLITPKTKFLTDLNHSVSLEFKFNEVDYKITRLFRIPDEVIFGQLDADVVTYKIAEAKNILGSMFFEGADYPGGYYVNKWFRDLIKFFIKDDINNHKQYSPINFVDYQATKTTLLTYNFYLLGLPNKSLYELDIVQQDIRAKRTAKTEIKKQIEQESGKDVSGLRTEIAKLNERIVRIQDSVQEFTFVENYKDAELELEDIARQISNKLQTYHSYNKTLEKYKESYSINLEVSISEVQALYKEIDSELANFVKKTLQDVVDFRSQIANNRKKFLADRERELKDAISKLIQEITVLENKRKTLYSLIQEEGAFDSIKNAYESLITEKVMYERDSAKLNQYLEADASIANLNKRVSEISFSIISDIRASQKTINEIRLLYKDILDSAIFVEEITEEGYLDIKESSTQNLPVDIIVSVPKIKSLGKNRFGLLAYSLTVFLNLIYTRRDLPNFLIHDGVFHSIDKKTIVNTLNYLHQHVSTGLPFQYIITGNDEEFNIPPEDVSTFGEYNFDFNKSVVATYQARPDQMIFGREF